MEFGWGHIFLLAKRMFLMKDAKIAELLKVDRSTIYRHIQKPTCRFDPAVNVYTAIFKLPDNKPETEQQYYENLRISLENDSFPPDFRSPKSDRYRESIEYLIKQANETGSYAKKKPPLEPEGGSDGTDNTSLQVQAETKLRFQEIDTIDFESEIESETQQILELSEPMYYGEYCSKRLSRMFDMYPGFGSPVPLDPALKEKWGSARISDEFYKSIEGYGIEPFLAITPSDLLPMGKILTGGNVIIHIRNAVRFVEHMKPAMDHMLITKENQKIFLDISDFVVLLGWYLNFLIENSNNSDLFAPEFILMIPDDNKELKQKANEYYDELKSRLENLEKRLESEDERRPDNG